MVIIYDYTRVAASVLCDSKQRSVSLGNVLQRSEHLGLTRKHLYAI